MQGGMNPYLHNVRTANTGKEATITVQREGVVKAKRKPCCYINAWHSNR